MTRDLDQMPTLPEIRQIDQDTALDLYRACKDALTGLSCPDELGRQVKRRMQKLVAKIEGSD